MQRLLKYTIIFALFLCAGNADAAKFYSKYSSKKMHEQAIKNNTKIVKPEIKSKQLVKKPTSKIKAETKSVKISKPNTQKLTTRRVTLKTHNSPVFSKGYKSIDVSKMERELNHQIHANIDQVLFAQTRPGEEFDHIWPVLAKQNRVTSGYGMRIHPVSGKPSFHSGIDIAAKEGSAIVASRAGKVHSVGYHKFLGYFVNLMHDDNEMTIYGHLQTYIVEPGQKVQQGEQIAKLGNTGRSTGPHLHYTLKKQGETVDPIHYIDVATRGKTDTYASKKVSDGIGGFGDDGLF